MVKIILILLGALIVSPCFAADPKPSEAEKAKNTIDQDRKDRQAAAGREIDAVLKKYRVQLSATMLVTDKGNIPQLNLVPVD